jgi:hypothetical protein
MTDRSSGESGEDIHKKSERKTWKKYCKKKQQKTKAGMKSKKKTQEGRAY